MPTASSLVASSVTMKTRCSGVCPGVWRTSRRTRPSDERVAVPKRRARPSGASAPSVPASPPSAESSSSAPVSRGERLGAGEEVGVDVRLRRRARCARPRARPPPRTARDRGADRSRSPGASPRRRSDSSPGRDGRDRGAGRSSWRGREAPLLVTATAQRLNLSFRSSARDGSVARVSCVRSSAG